MASNIEKGLSEQEKIDKKEIPRTSGLGQRPAPAKGKKTGKFTIK